MDPGLIELTEGGPADEEVSLILRLQDGAEPPPTVRVVCRFGPIITVRCRRADIQPTWESDRVISTKAPRAVHLPRQVGERGAPAEREEAAATELELDPEEAEVFAEGELTRRQRQPLPDLPVDGRGVVVGILDWGIDFTHPNFLNDDGTTRLLALWDQRGTGDPRAPAPYDRGRLFTREDINAALAQPDPCAALGYHPSSGDPGNTGSHGTHVTDIVAGNRRYPGSEVGLASGADLVFVHLGTHRLGELDNLGDSVGLLEGLDFVRRTAAAAGRPCVMHCSLGQTGGQHCGATLVERAVDVLLVERPGVVLVQSVGNYADTAMHTHARIGPDQTHTIDWLIPPGDRTPNELEIWYSGKDVFDVTLVAPDGQEFSAPLGRRARLGDGGAAWGNLYHRLHEPNSGLNHVDIFLYKAAPTGQWKVVVHGQNVVDGRLHAWIERDAGSRYQSRFSRAQATSSYTTNTICNSFHAIAVGAYDATRPERPPARFSSRGPTADGRQKPELSAPGFRILAARSMPRDGWNGERKLVVKSGTSMAAPWVSGTVALMFQAAGRPLTIHEVRRILIGTADPHAGPRGRSSSQLGFGYLNTAAAVAAASRLGGGTPAAPPPPPPAARSLEPDEAQPDEARPIGSTWIEVPLGEAAAASGCGDAARALNEREEAVPPGIDATEWQETRERGKRPSRIFHGRLTCLHFDTDKSFLLPSAIPGIRNIKRFYDQHPGLKVLVNGHTDKVGAEQYNLTLSVERVKSIVAYLQDHVEEWLKWYGSDKQLSKRWSYREDQHMLSVLSDAQGVYYTGPIHGLNDHPTQAAVRRFQTASGLIIDGQSGPQTRRELIRQYMAQDGTTLPPGTELYVHGCGEFHPIHATKQADQGNRRVEIFLFDGSVDPPPRDPCPAPGCTEYLQWVSNAKENVDLCQKQTSAVDYPFSL